VISLIDLIREMEDRALKICPVGKFSEGARLQGRVGDGECKKIFREHFKNVTEEIIPDN
jgi:hypothetical protein